jgi:stress-induced morphogen
VRVKDRELRFAERLRYPDFSFMIGNETVTAYIREAMPDAQVSVTDLTGTKDHLSVRVISGAFQGKNILDRHRMIYQALSEPMKDGRIHALELKAETPDGG